MNNKIDEDEELNVAFKRLLFKAANDNINLELTVPRAVELAKTVLRRERCRETIVR